MTNVHMCIYLICTLESCFVLFPVKQIVFFPLKSKAGFSTRVPADEFIFLHFSLLFTFSFND